MDETSIFRIVFSYVSIVFLNPTLQKKFCFLKYLAIELETKKS